MKMWSFGYMAGFCSKVGAGFSNLGFSGFFRFSLATSRASTDLRRYINSDLGFSNQQISNFCNIDDVDFRKKLVCVMYGCVSGEILSLEQAFGAGI